MKRLFCVQPFGIRRHKLVASGAIVFEDQDEAIATGMRLARSRAGVVVLSQDMDARLGMLSKPKVIAIHGRVPASWREVSVALNAA